MNLFELTVAAFGGGLVVKCLDILYVEVRRRLDSNFLNKEYVQKNIDPLLKSADELVGKLASLAREDFQTLWDEDSEPERFENHDYRNLLYLLALFWANIEILRSDNRSVVIAHDQLGKNLKEFLNCLESRQVRLVDRGTQRAIAELLLERRGERLGIRKFIDFVGMIEGDDASRRWIEPVAEILARTRHTTERQKVLQYGVVLHAFTDTLDPKKEIHSDRRPYPDKLSRRTRRFLEHTIFKVYLKSVKEPRKYLGPPK